MRIRTGCGKVPGPPLAPPAPVNLEAILLDIDGTLIDSNDKHTDCWVEAFAHFGKDVGWEVMRGQIGKGGDLLVPDLLDAREMRTFGEELKEFRGELWTSKFMRTVEAFPGAVEAMRALRGRGLKLALASSSNPECFLADHLAKKERHRFVIEIGIVLERN